LRRYYFYIAPIFWWHLICFQLKAARLLNSASEICPLLGHEKYEDRTPDHPYLSARIVKDRSVPLKSVLRPFFGFTLVELLAVLAIAATLTAIALPSFQDISERNRVAADVNKLVRALYLARSEAIKRRVRTTLCRSSNPEAGLPTCSGTWTQGWILFADTVNNNTHFDNGEPLIAVHNGLQSRNTLKWNNGNNIRYLPSGTPPLNFLGGTFTICSQNNKHARGVIISSSGRVRLSNDSDTLTCP
jgi:type IV fimbrial biogenesis protein FimT